MVVAACKTPRSRESQNLGTTSVNQSNRCRSQPLVGSLETSMYRPEP
jgi:hypothetical protein